MIVRSILAGFFIGIGATVYLTIGGVVGAAFFSVGLASILLFDLHLFTGKAGLLSTREIKVTKLIVIWIYNFVGAVIFVVLLSLTPLIQDLSSKAVAILSVRDSNSFLDNLILGFFCGVLMYVAVTGYKKSSNLFFIILPIVTFIIIGCNHCVADMVYLTMSGEDIRDLASLVPTTIGNIVGCNFIPTMYKLGGNLE